MKKEKYIIDKKGLEQAFLEIQMPRTPFILENMVVNSKFTEEQKCAQCVLELSIAYDNLRTAKCAAELKKIELKGIKGKTKKSKLIKEMKAIELEQLNRARLGALREFEYLYFLWEKFPKRFTRQEINEAQPTEFRMKLELQALMDKNATGRISVGNQEGLRQIGKMPFPELDYSREVDKRFLNEGDIKISIVVPTEFKDEKLECLKGLEFPNGVQIRIENCYGLPVDDAYNKLFQTAIDAQSDYVLTIEDDTFPPKDALIKLLELIKKHPNTAIGAWYPKKQVSRQGVHIILKDGKRQQMECDNNIQEAYTLSMGCSLYPIEMFKKIAFPWFKTTSNLSQDSFFSQLAREAGFKLLVDTSIQCKHIDRETGEVFEKGEKQPLSLQVKEELDELLKHLKNKKLILEIGTARGGTLKEMMRVASNNAEFVSIDLPGGSYGGEMGQPEEKLMTSWLNKNQKLSIIRDDSKSFLTVEKVKEILKGRKFDFIFIDGDHSYSGVKADYTIYKELLVKSGEIAFHDIAHHKDNNIGVEKLWSEIKGEKTEYIKDKKQGWAGIGIIKIK